MTDESEIDYFCILKKIKKNIFLFEIIYLYFLFLLKIK